MAILKGASTSTISSISRKVETGGLAENQQQAAMMPDAAETV
jgi:hypothetical protein